MLENVLKECCRTCKHSEITTRDYEDYYGTDTLGYTCEFCVSSYLDDKCGKYEPIDRKELFNSKLVDTSVIYLNLPLSSVIISVGWNQDYRVIKEYVKEHFNNSRDVLSVFLFQQCCVYNGNNREKVLWGYFDVKSVEEFQAMVDNNRGEVKDPKMPSYLVQMGEEIGKQHYMANYVEEQMAQQMEQEMQEQYEKEMQEQYEFEQWREETFTSDGEIIED